MRIFGKERQEDLTVIRREEEEKLCQELDIAIRPVLEKFGERE